MRHPGLVPLSQDHHHGLALALRCRKQALGQIKPMGKEGLLARAEEFRQFYTQNLAPHFRAEEEVLFPFMLSVVPESRMLVDQLLKDHEFMRSAVSNLAAETGLAKLIFDLGDLLELHIRKEERELFPLFETHAGTSEAEAAGDGIRRILAAPSNG